MITRQLDISTKISPFSLFCCSLLLQMLLHENSSVLFSNNIAYEFGAGLYVEDPSSDFALSIFNTGCFIRYNTSEVDIPPCEWVSMSVTKFRL